MATLQFKGKSAVWNHHLSVPYHTLEKDAKKSFKGTDAEENLIIEGDNLLALKSLLPVYQGRVKCIYIDPPYNTGNEGWVYNDSVNSPTIQSWIGEAVGKDDLTRHDKWLCMMTPRLKLLRELLDDDGVLFISIDENEASNLKLLLDDIFTNGYLGTISVVNNWKGRSDDEYIATCNEYLLAYAKDRSRFEMYGFPLSQENIDEYDQTDELGPYKEVGLRKTGKGWRREDRPNMYYPIFYTESTRELSLKKSSDAIEILPLTKDNEDGRWRWGADTFEKRKAQDVVVRQVRGGAYRAFSKMRLNDPDEEGERTLLPKSTWIDPRYDTAKGNQALKDLFETKSDLFENPKPVEFVKDILRISTASDAIILDSFAGSGTTAQAVLELNKEIEGSNRKFILVQMPEEIEKDTPAHKMGFRWIHEITRDRVKRVVERIKNKLGFTYYTLGPAIDSETLLGGDLPKYNEFAKYVYYLATGKNHPDEKKIKESTAFVGKADNESVYLIYEQEMSALKKLAITLDWAQKTHAKDNGKKIVYAPACYLDDEMLDQFNIKFVSIPYNLFERNA